MSELTDRIREISGSDLAREFFAAPDGQTLKREYLEGNSTPQDILDVFSSFRDYSKLFLRLFVRYLRDPEGFEYYGLIGKDLPFPTHLLAREDYFSHLSMTVYEHNSRKSLIAPMDFTFLLEEMIEDAREDEVEEIDELLRDDFTFRFYNWSRIVVGIVPYIAFGDRSGLVGIEEGSVQEYLKLTENMFPTPNVTIDKPEIKSDEFWIMKQLYKNAGEATNRKFRYEYGVENDFPERSVSVGIADDVLYVEDNGDGIPAEVLNSIFGIYTSSGAGLGLQMVKRIVDLRNGHIVVTSTQEGEDTFQYDTRTDQVTELDEAKPRGTKFEVYFGKEE